MSKRKPGSNKRQPRTTGTNGRCVRYFADDPNNAAYFTPKPREKRKQIQRDEKGNFVVVIKEKALL